MRIHPEYDTRAVPGRPWNLYRPKRQAKEQQFSLYEGSQRCYRSARKRATENGGQAPQEARVAAGCSGEEMLVTGRTAEAQQTSSYSRIQSTGRRRRAYGPSVDCGNGRGRSTSEAAEGARSKIRAGAGGGWSRSAEAGLDHPGRASRAVQ